jgi:hypothetical protein
MSDGRTAWASGDGAWRAGSWRTGAQRARGLAPGSHPRGERGGCQGEGAGRSDGVGCTCEMERGGRGLVARDAHVCPDVRTLAMPFNNGYMATHDK